jgi:hypothetical protein
MKCGAKRRQNKSRQFRGGSSPVATIARVVGFLSSMPDGQLVLKIKPDDFELGYEALAHYSDFNHGRQARRAGTLSQMLLTVQKLGDAEMTQAPFLLIGPDAIVGFKAICDWVPSQLRRPELAPSYQRDLARAFDLFDEADQVPVLEGDLAVCRELIMRGAGD